MVVLDGKRLASPRRCSGSPDSLRRRSEYAIPRPWRRHRPRHRPTPVTEAPVLDQCGVSATRLCDFDASIERRLVKHSPLCQGSRLDIGPDRQQILQPPRYHRRVRILTQRRTFTVSRFPVDTAKYSAVLPTMSPVLTIAPPSTRTCNDTLASPFFDRDEEAPLRFRKLH